MKLTIEIVNPTEVEQVLRIFKTLNLESVRIVVDKNTNQKEAPISGLLARINRPIKKRIDLDTLKKQKNYKGVNRKRFDKLVQEINITEPIDVLLSQLSR